jgi:hypothetical protein
MTVRKRCRGWRDIFHDAHCPILGLHGRGYHAVVRRDTVHSTCSRSSFGILLPSVMASFDLTPSTTLSSSPAHSCRFATSRLGAAPFTMFVAPHLVPCHLSCTVACHGWAPRRFATPSSSPSSCYVYHAVIPEAVVLRRSRCPRHSSLVARRRSSSACGGLQRPSHPTRSPNITSLRYPSTIVWRRHLRGADSFIFSFLYLRVPTSHSLLALASCGLFISTHGRVAGRTRATSKHNPTPSLVQCCHSAGTRAGQ